MCMRSMAQAGDTAVLLRWCVLASLRGPRVCLTEIGTTAVECIWFIHSSDWSTLRISFSFAPSQHTFCCGIVHAWRHPSHSTSRGARYACMRVCARVCQYRTAWVCAQAAGKAVVCASFDSRAEWLMLVCADGRYEHVRASMC